VAKVYQLMADLDAFLAEKAALPWAWGVVDCCMVPADWAIANGYGDLMALERGKYADEAGAQAVIVRRGGLFPIVSDGCARAGLVQAEVPSRGVIAVIGSLLAPSRQWGAIWDGTRWLVRDATGFTAVTARPLAMWTI